MAQRVLLHIGLPKTGTTYLQQILWDNRATLESHGVWLPGRTRREHLWAALECSGADMAKRPARATGALDRLCTEIAADRRPTALISHEFFCGASADAARSLVERLAPAEVEVIVTARDAAGMLAAGWQELVKNGSAVTLEEAAARESGSEFSWQTWDLGGVLERWSPWVPAERVHVLPMPPSGSAPEQHWLNFASVLGVGGDSRFSLPERAVNTSLGAVQVELLRRLSAYLGEVKGRPVDRGEWIRGYLAEGHLGAQRGDRFGLPQPLHDACAARSRRAVDLIERAGFAVVGDPAGLLPSGALLGRADPARVDDAALLDAAAELIASMLGDVRDLTKRLAADDEPAGVSRRLAARVPRRARRRSS